MTDEHLARPPLLSIVTVVFNDAEGLARTIQSAERLLEDDAEMWIIDGSTHPSSAEFTRSIDHPKIRILVEPDHGIYDAMNKGLDRAHGDWLVFMNAGDCFDESFTLSHLRDRGVRERSPIPVLIGYCLEVWGRDIYLNPGIGRESDAFDSPKHQATIYPHSVYSQHRFDDSLAVAADGRLTGAAIRVAGAAFIPAIVARFAYGGASSSYSLTPGLRRRFEEVDSRTKVKLLGKVVLWHLLPRATFYRVLAQKNKYTPFTDSTRALLRHSRIDRPPIA